MITMLLGGLWHGAGWTFVVWGGLHGIYLVINHAFVALRRKIGWSDGRFGRAGAWAGTTLTFASVVVAWVFFRAESFGAASDLLHGMAGAFGVRRDGLLLPISNAATGLDGQVAVPMILAALAVVWLLPNTQEFMRAVTITTDSIARPSGLLNRLVWNPVRWWAWVSAGTLLAHSLWTLSGTHVSEFLYYQF